jgi:lambda family phage portal protein
MFEAIAKRISKMFGGTRQPVSQRIVVGGGVQRYAAGTKTRLRGGWSTPNSSANAMLDANLKQMRNSSRALMRDSSYAKRAAMIVVNNVIGTGIGIQANIRSTRNELRTSVNDAIEAAWAQWCMPENCSVGGELHFYDLERLALRQVVDAGEVFIKVHLRALGDSAVPMSLEIIEAERIADEYVRSADVSAGNIVVMGIEVDQYHRPQAYWVRDYHPGDHRLLAGKVDQTRREPASIMFHMRIFTRYPQTRGEPWLHTAINKLHDMDEYTSSEVTAAAMSAKIFGSISKSPDMDPDIDGPSGATTEADGSKSFNIESGVMYDLDPGESMNLHAPNRPNSALDPFLRYMVREVATGVGVSYASLSGDYSQTNYSSSRLALLDDRDCWKVLQQWWIRTFRQRLHSIFIRQAVYSRGIGAVSVAEYIADPMKFESVRWKLRGWSWIDPAKEVAAYKEAVRAGFTTITKVIDQTADGSDLEDIIEQRRAELDALEAADIPVDTTPTEAVEPVPVEPTAQPDTEDDAEDNAEDDTEEEQQPAARVVALRK